MFSKLKELIGAVSLKSQIVNDTLVVKDAKIKTSDAQNETSKTEHNESLEENLKKMFENYYRQGKEQIILRDSTQDKCTCAEYNSEEYNNIEKLNSHFRRVNRIFTDEMKKRYNEAEVKKMLTNDPQAFFERGWCYPDFEWCSLLVYRTSKESAAATGYSWNFLLPESFWESADNIQLFYTAAEEYWNARIQPYIEKPAKMLEDDVYNMAYLAFGFKYQARLLRVLYEEKIDKELHSFCETQSGSEDPISESKKINFDNLMQIGMEKAKLMKIKPFDCDGFEFIFQQKMELQKHAKEKEEVQYGLEMD